MFATLQQRFRRMVFLEHKPESGEVFLKQRRVFTLPGRSGMVFVLLLLVLFIAATNYNLSLGFALTFVLGACAWINAFLTFRNLAYLHLLAGPVQPVFAGEEAQFTLHLINRRKHQRYAIFIGFAGEGHQEQPVDIAPDSRTSVQLSAPTVQRGRLPTPRVRLQTWFPLGLLRAWSTWLPDAQALVYPQPEVHAPPLPYAGSSQSDGQGHAGNEDFSGVRAYQVGDAIKHLAWKHIARLGNESGGPLITKEFAGGSASDLTLDFDSLPRSMDTELKLSRMTRWVLDADATALPYAFRLHGISYPPRIGQAHRMECLQALALFELSGLNHETS
ncbi:DUF58 domain-containing protein [Undibacterium sp.]|uniref:DUF58 domain-containing protein n=1 Tax=Undibacterium sp. TaxID=1914977 RepID=UPI00374CC4F7